MRSAPKDFRQRRPDGSGGWISNLGDVRRVLYRLPELLAAGPTRPVFVPEGEKDVDALWGIGYLATTNAMGAGKWRPQYSESLRGRHVVILPDNDQPGRQHAQAVAQSLAGVAASVRILELLGLPAKGDVSNWLDQPGNDKLALLKLVEATPPPGSAPAPTGKADDRPAIEITTEEHVVNEAAAAALGRDATLYQRGGALVRVTRDARPLGPRIEPLPAALLLERLAACARWISIGRDRDGEETRRAARPPGWCVSAVHVRGHWPGVPHLEAVIEYPVLRPDGTLLATPGYDAATGLLFEPAGPVPPIPERPTRHGASVTAGWSRPWSGPRNGATCATVTCSAG